MGRSRQQAARSRSHDIGCCCLGIGEPAEDLTGNCQIYDTCLTVGKPHSARVGQICGNLERARTCNGFRRVTRAAAAINRQSTRQNLPRVGQVVRRQKNYPAPNPHPGRDSCGPLTSRQAVATDMTYVDFREATFRVAKTAVERLRQSDALLRTLVYRPKIFQRNDIRWVSAYSWRTGAKIPGIAALKEIKQNPDPELLSQAGETIAALIRQLFGDTHIEAVATVPCGHSRRADCFGKRLAQAVATVLGLPFVQIFADRPCPGVSHPKQSVGLPALQLIVTPPRSVVVVDDLATSGRHLEEVVLALRRLGVSAIAIAWISGAASDGATLSTKEVAPKNGEPPRLTQRWLPAWL